MKQLLQIFIFLLVTFVSGLGRQSSIIPTSNFNKSNAAVNLNLFAEGVLKSFKEEMKESIPKYNIPVMEPYKSQKVSTNITRIFSEANIKFTKTFLYGLSEFSVSFLDFSIKKRTCFLSLAIPTLRFEGLYRLNSTQGSASYSESGNYMLEGNDFSIQLKASMSIEDDKLQVSDDAELTLSYAEKVDFSVDAVNNNTINFFENSHKILYEVLLRANNKNIYGHLLKYMNAKLAEFPARAFIVRSTSANEYIDDLLKKLVKSDRFKKLDPYNLPEKSKGFSYKVLFKTISGQSRLYNGKLTGLSSLHRIGDCDVDITKYTIFVDAKLGIRNLTLTYNAEMKFMNFGPTLELIGKIPYIDFQLKLRQSAEHGAPAVLEGFKFLDMSNIKIHINGLGPVSFLAETMTNLWLAISKKTIINMVTFGIKLAILSELLVTTIPIW